MSAAVTMSLENDVAVITVDDGKANAMTPEIFAALDAAFDEALQAKAVVLAGRPGRFSAGFDLKLIQAPDPTELVRAGGNLMLKLYAYPRPLVGAITGHAVALGAIIAMTCDTRIGAAGDFKIGMNETMIGMVLPQFGLIMARERLDSRRLTEALIQARLYTPEEAADIGYLDEVAAPESVVETAKARAAALAALPTETYAAQKLELRKATLARLKETMV